MPMLLRPLAFRRPDLERDVRALIGTLCGPPPDEALRLPIPALVKMLGVRVSTAFEAQLAARGDLHVHGARFSNHGPVIRRDVRLFGMGATLEVPALLGGVIERGPDHFQFLFDPGTSASVGRLVFETELGLLSVTSRRIQLRFRTGPDVTVLLHA